VGVGTSAKMWVQTIGSNVVSFHTKFSDNEFGIFFVCLERVVASVVNKDLTLKAKAKDSKFVLEDTSRPRTKAKDNNTGSG